MKKNKSYLEVRFEFDAKTKTDKFYHCLSGCVEVSEGDFAQAKRITLRNPSIAALLAISRVCGEKVVIETHKSLPVSAGTRLDILGIWQDRGKKIRWLENAITYTQNEYNVSNGL